MPAIKSLAAASLLVLAAVATHAQEKPGAPPAGRPADAAIIASERALHDAVVKGDRAAFTSLVLPDGVWTTRHGFVPLNLLAGNLGTFGGIRTWEIVNPHVTWLDDSAAIVAYVRSAAGEFEGEPVSPMALATTVWVKRNGKWVAAQHQETDQQR